jgi:hypothetical protein
MKSVDLLPPAGTWLNPPLQPIKRIGRGFAAERELIQ